MKVTFSEVCEADFDMQHPGAAVTAVSAYVRRLGGGGFMGDRLLNQALLNSGAASDRVKAYNRIVRVLNTGEWEWNVIDFCNAMEIPNFESTRTRGLLARLRYLLTGR